MLVSNDYTPFCANGLTCQHSSLLLLRCGSCIGEREVEVADRLVDINHAAVKKQLSEFLATRLYVLRHVHNAIANSQDKRKKKADSESRRCIESYEFGDQVLLDPKNLPTNVVSAA